MMKRRGISLGWIEKVTLLSILAFALPVQAQPPRSINDFHLPPGRASSVPAPAGPVDPENPAPLRNLSSPLPQPVPAPSQVATQPSAPGAVSPVASEDTAASLSPQQMAGDLPPVTAAEPPPDIQPAPDTILTPLPVDVLAGSPPTPAAATAQTIPAPTAALPWVWWGTLLAFLLLFFLRQRAPADDNGCVGQGEEQPLLTAEVRVPTFRTGNSLPLIASSQVELVLEPQCLIITLSNARFAYRLSVTNSCDTLIGPVSITCDIISAHASLSVSEQLLFRADKVEPRHKFPALAPGESISLTSELQLPIAAIRPIHAGDVSLFAPLVRFCIVMPDAVRLPLVSTKIFIIGESPRQPGGRLRLIQIDRGPHILSRIGLREVKLSATAPLPIDRHTDKDGFSLST